MNSEEKRISMHIKNQFVYALFKDLQHLFLSMSIGLQSVALLVIIFLAGIGVVGAFIDGRLLLIYLFLFTVVALPTIIIFLRRMGYLNSIMKQTEDMAKGRLNSEIAVRGKSVLAKHAA